MIDLYTTTNCPACAVMKGALRANNIEFTEHDCSDKLTMKRFKYAFPTERYAPVIAIRNTVIAGLDELLTIVKNDQIHLLP